MLSIVAATLFLTPTKILKALQQTTFDVPRMKNETDEDVNDLVEQLEKLRVEREETNRVYHRAIRQSNEKEKDLIDRIHHQSNKDANNKNSGKPKAAQRRKLGQTDDEQFKQNLYRNKKNHIICGDIVRITNHYRPNEYGYEGTVDYVGRTMVEFYHRPTKAIYSRAWWNLEVVERYKK